MAPEPAEGVEAFRVLFGLIMFASTVRFVAKGWVHEFYVRPTYYFAWQGLEWLRPWPEPLLYAHFALVALSALGIAFGVAYRTSVLVFFAGFTVVELWDKTHYLNHYYLVSVLALFMCVMPLGRHLTWRGGSGQRTMPRWVRWVLRAQLSLVYFHAGLAKLNPDWLWRGEPLTTWLQVHGDLPLLGPLLVLREVAVAASWLGMVFDLAVAPLLWWRRTRGAAYAAVVAFHLATGLLLPIGMFPIMMIAFTTLFFEPDWLTRWSIRGGKACVPATQAAPLERGVARSGLAEPRTSSSILPRRPIASGRATPELPSRGLVVALGLLAIQAALPLRHHGYGGEVNWDERGFRFAWRVMLIEKTGSVAFIVHDVETGARWDVNPRDELTERQLAMMSTQPDMIRQYARHLAERYGAEDSRVRVFADAWVSLNGHPARRLFPPAQDLLADGVVYAPAAGVTDEACNACVRASASSWRPNGF